MKTLASFLLSAISLSTVLVVSGCASFGEGLGRALLEKNQQSEDTRQCYIRGPEFAGTEQLMTTTVATTASANSELKVFMVHGIGTHLPGYSTRLAENLAQEMGLTVVDREPKRIALRLTAPSEPIFADMLARGTVRGQLGDANGTLTVRTFRSKHDNRSMVFYELTWSEITAQDKRIIAYDNSGEYAFRRASLNRDLKLFINGHLPDPLIYLGDARGNILSSVSQALCWMFTQDYDNLPAQTDQICRIQDHPADQVRSDSYVFLSHSLGSRILIDSLQAVTASLASIDGSHSPRFDDWQDALQRESLTIYMLSNQLPLLQLGREAPAVINQYDDYCLAEGSKYGNRVFAKTNIVAFSDPNDLLSWAVPPDYENNNMDSRLCPRLVNVIINIAPVKSVLGVELAAPGDAHRGYDNDQRVIKLIAHGMSEEQADPMVQERCTWMEVR